MKYECEKRCFASGQWLGHCGISAEMFVPWNVANFENPSQKLMERSPQKIVKEFSTG